MAPDISDVLPEDSSEKADRDGETILEKAAAVIQEKVAEDENFEALASSMADLLGVADVQEAISESQQVVEVDDDTDL